MSQRRVPLAPDQIYHIFNRSTGHRQIFLHDEDYRRAIETLHYYSYARPEMSYSEYRRKPAAKKAQIISDLQQYHPLLIEIQAYSLMPTHFHILLKEIISNGTLDCLTNFQNSYAKYFNDKYENHGSVFQNRFKNVLIESDEQYIIVGEYIYLNPLEAGIVEKEEDLKYYPWYKKLTS